MEAIEKKIEKEIKEEAIEYKNCINKFNTIKEQWVDDEKAQEFISTLDKYAEQAVDMKACDSKIEFYQMYQNREYKYSQEFIEEIKKQYLESGASAIVNQKDVEFAFSRFETIGRGKYGNFVTSIKEDSNLLYDDFGRLHKGSVIESIKGVDPGKYDSGIYQYKYDTELVESFNKLGIIRTADGTTPGASSLNIPGCQTWAGKNIGYSESELIMPSIDVSEFDSSEVFNSIKENGFFEIKNPTIISPDGSKVQVNGSFKIEKLGE